MRKERDLLVIGSGIAGLSAAIHAADSGKNVIVLNRAHDLEESNTKYAQGGIVSWNNEDPPEILFGDIDFAGNESGSSEAIGIISKEGGPLVESFLVKRLRVPFDKDEGGIQRIREAAHSKACIIHDKDHTGATIQSALVREAKSHKNITFLGGSTAIDLISSSHHSLNPRARHEERKILGAYVLDRLSGEIHTILASKTVIATGGIGALWQYTTNPLGARGDGVAIADRAGVHVIDMEYMQFHPTVFRKNGCEPFLISEAVRGHGGILINRNGQRFMSRYNPEKMELAKRDEVARAIHEEMQNQGLPNVWLDFSPIAKKGVNLEIEFPTIYQKCRNFEVDINKEPAPVAPASHFICGGIKVDKWGRTNLTNLYAVGECSCTGLHGANRLASTSLLEGLVWGKRAAENICGNFEKEDFNKWNVFDWDESDVKDGSSPLDFITSCMNDLKRVMWQEAGLVRNAVGLLNARKVISKIQNEVENLYWRVKLSDEFMGLRNALRVAILVIADAQRNKTSRGCHFRSDGRNKNE